MVHRSVEPGGDPLVAEGFQFDLERMKPEGAIVQEEVDGVGLSVPEGGATEVTVGVERHGSVEIAENTPATWHGWRIATDPNGYSVHIGHLPGRKSVVLYSEDDDAFHVLTYFQSEEMAQEMADWIDRMQAAMNTLKAMIEEV